MSAQKGCSCSPPFCYPSPARICPDHVAPMGRNFSPSPGAAVACPALHLEKALSVLSRADLEAIASDADLGRSFVDSVFLAKRCKLTVPLSRLSCTDDLQFIDDQGSVRCPDCVALVHPHDCSTVASYTVCDQCGHRFLVCYPPEEAEQFSEQDV